MRLHEQCFLYGNTAFSIPNMKPFSTRTFQKDGHWIEKPHETAILVCECGEKYIKTRLRQKKCLRCMHNPIEKVNK